MGVKWKVKEDFFADSKSINSLQLRATYGTNGNVDRSTSPFLLARIKRGFAPFTGFSADIISVPNPELRLEKTKTLNLGIDYALFNYTVRGSIEYYVKDSEDLLAFTTLNPTAGVAGALINNGSLRNEGFDANIKVKVVDQNNFSYNTTANFSVNTNTLTKVDVPNDQLFAFVNGSVAVTGAALRTIYSYNYAGLDNNGAPQFFDEEGQIIDYQTFIDSTDALVKEGSLIPKYYGSWINNLKYKNFFLRTLATFKAGHVFRHNGSNVTYIPATGSPHTNVPSDFNDRWQNSGDENITDIPGIPSLSDTASSGYRYYRDSNKFVDSASHIRLSQIILGYNFNKNLLDRLGINGLQIQFQADNLAVWNFNKWNVDPESAFIPIEPTYTIKFSASF